MNEKPIIFSSEMVRAIFAGKKKQTRRIVKGWEEIEEKCNEIGSFEFSKFRKCDDGAFDLFARENRLVATLKPSWKVGQKLWVKETWRTFHSNEFDFVQYKENETIYRRKINDSNDDLVGPVYFLWGDYDDLLKSPDFKWNSPMFMPRWASRIKLEVTNIRLERLTDISASDIISEGFDVDSVESDCVDDPWGHWWHVEQAFFRHVSRVNHQHDDWATETTPLVWVIDFETVSIKGNAVKSSVNADCGA